MNRDREGKSNRETRHLWVGNFPEDSTKDDIFKYFERYGRVEAVKILPRRSQEQGIAAFVDFVDIRCAIKAYESPNRVRDRIIRTDYNEPSAGVVAKSRNRQTQDGGAAPASSTRKHYSNRYGSNQSGYEHNRYDYRRPKSRFPNSYAESSHDEQVTRSRKFHESDYYPSRVPRSPHADRRSNYPNTMKSDTRSFSPIDDSSRSRSKSLEKTPAITDVLRITNLTSRYDDDAIKKSLYHEFKKFSDRIRVKVYGSSRYRYALVRFSRSGDAEEAMRACNGRLLLGSEMGIQINNDGGVPLNNQSGSSRYIESNATRTLLVDDLDLSIESDYLRDLFGQFGKILDINVKERRGGRSCLAYVQFCSIDDAVSAKNGVEDTDFDSSKYTLNFTVGMPAKGIWIDDLSSRITEEDIRDMMNRFGKIEEIGTDKQNRAALVYFVSIDSAKSAVSEMTNYKIRDKKLKITYAQIDFSQFLEFIDGSNHQSNENIDKYRSKSRKLSSRDGQTFSGHRKRRYNRYDMYKGHGFGKHGTMYDDNYETSSKNKNSKLNQFSPHDDDESDEYSKELRDYHNSRQKERKREQESYQEERTDDKDVSDETCTNNFQKEDTSSVSGKDEIHDVTDIKVNMSESDTNSSEKYATAMDVDVDNRALTDNKLALNPDEQVSTTADHYYLHDYEGTSGKKTEEQLQPQAVLCRESNSNFSDDNVNSGVVGNEEMDLADTENPSASVNDIETAGRSCSQLIDDDSMVTLMKVKSNNETYTSERNDTALTKLVKEVPAEVSMQPLMDNRELISDPTDVVIDEQAISAEEVLPMETNEDTAVVANTEESRALSPGNSNSLSDESSKMQPADDVHVGSASNDSKVITSGDTTLSNVRSPPKVQELLLRYPVVWEGTLVLKNDTVLVQMHFLSGSEVLAKKSLSIYSKAGKMSPLKIAQRMKLEAGQLDSVSKRMQNRDEFCLLLALPCGRDLSEMQTQTNALRSSFISYLQQKEAAGIINIPLPDSNKTGYLHVFPPCEFSNDCLVKTAPDLIDCAADSGHLMIVVAVV